MNNKKTFIILGILFLTACTSYFKRKECEQVNWYEYGRKLALSGTRPASDEYINQCKKVEAHINAAQLDNGFKEGMDTYCKPLQVFETGKKGEKLNMDLCDPGQARILMAKHAEGVKVYCSVDNGYPEGSSGRVYTGICPQNLESAFMKEYRRGRKKFLQASVSTLEGSLHEKDEKIRDIQNEISQMTTRLALIPRPREVVERTYDPITHTMKENVRQEDDQYKFERDNLQRDIDHKNYEAQQIRKEQTALRDSLSKQKVELGTLE